MSIPFEKNLATVDGVVTVTTNVDTIPAVAPALDYEQMYLASKAESGRLQNIITAARIGTAPAPGADRRPPVSAEHIRRSVAPVAFLNMSRADKLNSLGISPDSVTDASLKKLFGRGNDGVAAKDLSVSNMAQYRSLREAAKILNLYGG